MNSNIYMLPSGSYRVKVVCDGKSYGHAHRTYGEAMQELESIQSSHPQKNRYARFWEKVHKPESGNGCWEYTGTLNAFGYGEFCRHILAHRYSYELAYGPIPHGLVIDHICHNPACVNPKHLRAITIQGNEENRKGAQRNNHTSHIRGVTWDKKNRKWRAQAKHDGKNYSTGRFDSLHDAEQAAINLRNKLMTFNDLDRIAHPTTK